MRGKSLNFSDSNINSYHYYSYVGPNESLVSLWFNNIFKLQKYQELLQFYLFISVSDNLWEFEKLQYAIEN